MREGPTPVATAVPALPLWPRRDPKKNGEGLAPFPMHCLYLTPFPLNGNGIGKDLCRQCALGLFGHPYYGMGVHSWERYRSPWYF